MGTICNALIWDTHRIREFGHKRGELLSTPPRATAACPLPPATRLPSPAPPATTTQRRYRSTGCHTLPAMGRKTDVVSAGRLAAPAGLPLVVRVHPLVRRDLARRGQLDHVDRWCVSPLAAQPAFQRGFQLPDRRVARAHRPSTLTTYQSTYRLSVHRPLSSNPDHPDRP
jgi:hypothetical protein